MRSTTEILEDVCIDCCETVKKIDCNDCAVGVLKNKLKSKIIKKKSKLRKG